MSAPKAEVSYVQYFIPTDGDSEEHPNVFVVRKSPKSLCLGDIVSAFPLPGEYLFRAKYSYGKTHVWLDLNGSDEAVPQFGTKFILKVSRVSLGIAGSGSNGGSGLIKNSASTGVIAGAAATKASIPSAVRASTSSHGSEPTGAGTSRSAAAVPSPRVDTPPSQPQQSQHEQDDLLGMLGGAGSSTRGAGAAAASPSIGGLGLDLLGNALGQQPPPPPRTSIPQTPVPAPQTAYIDPFATAPPPTRAAPTAAAPKTSASILEGNIFNM